MATLATQKTRVAGTKATYAAASAGGDKVAPDDTALHVKNGSASPITVTAVTPNTVQGQAIGDVATVIAAGEEWFIGPFPRKDFAGADGLVSITYSAVTTVTVAAIRVA